MSVVCKLVDGCPYALRCQGVCSPPLDPRGWGSKLGETISYRTLPRYILFRDALGVEHALAREPRPCLVSRESGDPFTYTKSLTTEVCYRLRVYYSPSNQVEHFFEFRNREDRDRVWEFFAPSEECE